MNKFNNWFVSSLMLMVAVVFGGATVSAATPTISVGVNNTVYVSPETVQVPVYLNSEEPVNSLQFDIKYSSLVLESIVFNTENNRLKDIETSFTESTGRVVLTPKTKFPIPAIPVSEEPILYLNMAIDTEAAYFAPVLQLSKITFSNVDSETNETTKFTQDAINVVVYAEMTLSGPQEIEVVPGQSADVALGIDTCVPVLGISFTIQMPEGVSLAECNAVEGIDAEASWLKPVNNSLEVVVLGNGDAIIEAGECNPFLNLVFNVAEDAVIGENDKIVFTKVETSVGYGINTFANKVNDVTVDVVKQTSGINAVAVEDSNATYYDINGSKVLNPVSGKVYIKVSNGKASKFYHK